MLTAAWAAPPAPANSGALGDIKELDSRKLTSDPETWPGAAVYRGTCSHCHEGQVPKAPHKMFLQMMAPDAILGALTSGMMKAQGASLTPTARRQVAEYLSGTQLDKVIAPARAPLCAARGAEASGAAGATGATGATSATSAAGATGATGAADTDTDTKQLPAAYGWGYDNARFIPADIAHLTAAEVPHLKLRWAFEFPRALRARSQPAIAYGSVYVGSQDGTVYSLALNSGCVRWTYRSSAEVRTAMVLETAAGAANGRLYFGDVIARMHAVDGHTGKSLWMTKVDEHPNATITGTPALHNGVLYVPVSSLEVTTAADAKYECCKFRGSIVALDASTGRRLWKTYAITEEPKPVRTTPQGTRIFAPSGAPIWNTPTIDSPRGMLYVGTGENYSSPANDRSDAVLAIRLRDGQLIWSQQLVAGDAWNVACMMQNNPNCPQENGPDVDVAAGTILTKLSDGRDILLAGQKNGYAYALDPANAGKLLWKVRVGRGGIQGGVHFGMTLEGNRLYVPISDMENGHDGRKYDMQGKPGLYALDPATGKTVWSAPAVDVCKGRQFCDPGISAALTAVPGVVFAGHMDGVLRAYDSSSGRVIWQYDSTAPVHTVSGSTAHGGSFGGPGVTVRDGYLAVNSGYGLYFHMPGNVLLVFSTPGKEL